MKNKFLELCRLVLNVEKLENEVEDYREVIKNKVNEFNHTFSLKDKYELRFEDKAILMTPVPFAAPPLKPKYALVGLNPKFDKGKGAIEKKQAGKNWNAQASYYNSWDVFKMALEKESSYYINRIKFFHAINSGAVIEKKDILSNYKCDSFFEVFKRVMNEAPTIFAEFIPFHSESFQTLSDKKIEDAFCKISGYKAYLLKLVDLINEKLPEDGVIIFDGKNPSDVYKNILKDELKSLKKKKFFYKKKEKPAYEICKWKERLVVFTGGTIYGTYTAINGKRIKTLVEDLKY